MTRSSFFVVAVVMSWASVMMGLGVTWQTFHLAMALVWSLLAIDASSGN